MKLLLYSGSHSRHVFVHKRLIEEFDIAGIVSMDRESERPTPGPQWTEHDRELYNHHFQRRYEVEKSTYGDLSVDFYESVAPTLYVDRDELNSQKVLDFVTERDADVCFIFGTGLILDPVLGVLPDWRLNFHLGLSPWYKGSATLFWPFYFLEPRFAGGTLHQITPSPDAGPIIHHSLPELKRGQGIHEVAADVVVEFRADTVRLLRYLEENGTLPTEEQSSSGKLFLSSDFIPPHLRMIYDVYDNDIVDAWLDGELRDQTPDMIDAIDKLELDQ